MKIGIKFQVPSEWGKLIESILSGIDIERYIWKITEDQVFSNEEDEFLFGSEIIEGNNFKKIISKKKYYTMFANIQGFERKEKIQNIENYNDFIKSECKIVILISDGIYVTIYSKVEDDIKTIKKNAETNKFKEIDIITRINKSDSKFKAI